MANGEKKPRMGLSAKIFLGLGLGIVAGVFFGESVAFLDVVGEVFIQLLQMAVLPFVVVSLVAGLGRLTYGEALSLGKKCGVILLLLWAIAIAVILLMPLAFPNWPSASFFSSTLIEDRQEIDFLELYVPANPFHSLAISTVPAIVLFSIAVGVALIGIEKKGSLLDSLDTLLDALTRVTGFVVQLAPIGVFAIAANAAGTMDLEELGRLQVYLLTFIAVALVLTLWVLPVLVTTLTPFTYREVMENARSALITAFATGNLMIILPLLAGRGKELFQRRELSTEESDSAMDVIVPTSFTFPSIGLLLSLGFVPFAAWYVGANLSVGQYPTFVASGLFSMFGGAVVAIPLLLDLLRIPADLFQLFITVDVFTSRFGTLLAAMHVWVLALLGTCAVSGRLVLRWKQVLQYGVVSILLIVVTVGGAHLLFAYGFDPEYTKYRSFVEMDIMVRDRVQVTIHKNAPPPLHHDPNRRRLDEIRERGLLRVGYKKDSLPFAFRNASNDLVGYDIEMAHLLAKEIGVALEFVKIDPAKLFEELNAGCCDIVMSGTALTAGRTQRAEFSAPHLDMTMAFMVEDYRRDEFASWEFVRSQRGLRIGIPGESRYYVKLLQELVPQAEVVRLRSPREFLRGEVKDLDAVAFVAEAGSAWTLVYPAFSVAVPMPDPIAVPLAYPMPKGSEDLTEFVSTWIALQRDSRKLDHLFDHWILGKGAEKKEPRWSVIRNVLGWVE